MNKRIQAFLKRPSHAVLLTGQTADVLTAEAGNMATTLLEGHEDYLRHEYPDEKGTIAIEQVRKLIAFFQLKVPGTAAVRRVVILHGAEAMSVPAQNALLKLLEEPPTDSVLILTSVLPQQLLPTIRSRMQLIHLEGADQAPDNDTVQLVKQVLGGTTYDRLLLVDGPLKSKDVAVQFVDTLATVAVASLAATAKKGSNTSRWQGILGASYAARDAFERNGNTKLVLTELMLAL